jgi:hypothetical protein
MPISPLRTSLDPCSAWEFLSAGGQRRADRKRSHGAPTGAPTASGKWRLAGVSESRMGLFPQAPRMRGFSCYRAKKAQRSDSEVVGSLRRREVSLRLARIDRRGPECNTITIGWTKRAPCDHACPRGLLVVTGSPTPRTGSARAVPRSFVSRKASSRRWLLGLPAARNAHHR